ncbi:MAG: SWIM zinc finger family protein [Caldilineaceae bacterium]|nr:SWIM zinc finger family protein [Caldilineaceae bacterium]
MPRYPKPTRRIETDEGIKAKGRGEKFAENWWAERWIKALEQITDAGRLRRGRSYARSGQVLSIEEKQGGIEARVQGSRTTPYRVKIHLKALTPAEWNKVLAALAERAIFTAQLLAGEMPPDIEEAFAAAGVSLFPAQGSDLETACSCPDFANPCKHVAATHYILGERFDADPFLLFRLRGRSQDEIFASLRAMRSAEEINAVAEEGAAYVVDETPPLEDAIADFWSMGASLAQFPTQLHEPTTPLPILRRLGQPAFLVTKVEKALGPLYINASARALEVAYAAEPETPDPNTDFEESA